MFKQNIHYTLVIPFSNSGGTFTMGAPYKTSIKLQNLQDNRDFVTFCTHVKHHGIRLDMRNSVQLKLDDKHYYSTSFGPNYVWSEIYYHFDIEIIVYCIALLSRKLF